MMMLQTRLLTGWLEIVHWLCHFYIPPFCPVETQQTSQHVETERRVKKHIQEEKLSAICQKTSQKSGVLHGF